MDNLGFWGCNIMLNQLEPSQQSNIGSTAKECMESIIFGEVRANSVDRTLLDVSSNDVDVSQ